MHTLHTFYNCVLTLDRFNHIQKIFTIYHVDIVQSDMFGFLYLKSNSTIVEKKQPLLDDQLTLQWILTKIVTVFLPVCFPEEIAVLGLLYTDA